MITIDNEFQNLIPPLTDEEFAQLETNILRDGIRDALITWHGILIDGHNRYRIAQKHGLTYRTVSSVIKSAIVWRGTEKDTDNIVKIACSKKFENASATVKQLTLEKYFDVPNLFRRYTLEDLPTRYLNTYADVYKVWEMKFADGY